MPTDKRVTSTRNADLTSPDYWNVLIRMSLSRFFVLCVLDARPMHGYELTRAVEVQSNGCCAPGAGTLYPLLRELEAGGYVTRERQVVDGRERKVYTITELGREAFRVATRTWLEVTSCIVGETPSRGCARCD